MSLTYMNLEDVEDHFVDLMTIYNPFVTLNMISKDYLFENHIE